MLLVKTRIGFSQINGLGLFAAEFIPKGTPVWKMVRWFDLILTKEQMDKLSDPAREQFLRCGHLDMYTGEYVLCADEARYLNHSETPNIRCSDSSDGNEDLDVAIRDIEEGEEITINYKEYDANWPLKLNPR
jgi:SET domain-containing protein